MGARSLFSIAAALVLGVLAILWARGTFTRHEPDPERTERLTKPHEEPAPTDEVATFAGGCFWCTEAVFQQLKGVHSAVPGYTGGTVENPTYKQVCTGTTGHAESIQVTFDPRVISYEELLEVFWKTHDPTTKDRQGNDVGPHYRSVVFYHTPKQKELAEHYKNQLGEAKAFDAPIVTEIVAASKFYPAEEYHRDYFINNPSRPYCAGLIRPKLEKFEKAFANKLKSAKP